MLDLPAVKTFVQENIPLAPFTTLGIGGPARYLAEATSEEHVLEAIEFARSKQLPLLILGGGSNLLVSDAGFPGLVLRVAIAGTRETETEDRILLRVGAGVDWDAFVAQCVRRSLFGIECLSGIPGWVGATPVQNVGAYGQEVSEVVSSVRLYDRNKASITEMTSAECGFSYRTSVFNTTERGRYVVLEVEFSFPKAGRPKLDYPDLERFFQGKSGDPSLTEVREAVRRIRADKAMLLVDGDPDSQSAGSFFKNPIVSDEVFRSLEQSVVNRLGTGETLPHYPAEDGFKKVPAAWLIESAGYRKGTSRGPVGLSRKHTLAVVNQGGATATDVLDFAAGIQRGVEEVFEIRLRTEPVFVGFPEDVAARFGAVTVS